MEPRRGEECQSHALGHVATCRGRVVLKPVAEKLEELEDKESKGPRRFKITKRDLESAGYTRGCQQREHILKEGVGRGGLQHGERCIERESDDVWGL